MDIFPNEDADANVVLAATESWTEQEKEVLTENILNIMLICVFTNIIIHFLLI